MRFMVIVLYLLIPILTSDVVCPKLLTYKFPFCPIDIDADGISNESDNCLVTPNFNQADLDGDATGDACDPDVDGDGIPDCSDLGPLPCNDTTVMQRRHAAARQVDNCLYVANQDQMDRDSDSIGDACDSDKNGDNILD